MAQELLNLFKDTRAEVVRLLKLRGELTVEGLASELGISKVAVRRHLEQLELRGLVCYCAQRCERGRPRHVYSLTPAADTLFPNTNANFACSLLEQIRASFGVAAVERLLHERADELIRSLAVELEGLSFAERVASIARRFNELGYVTEVEALEDGSFRVVEHNCPTREVAEQFRQLCAEELRVYREASGAEVSRRCEITTGGARCEYRIAPPRARSLPVIGGVAWGARNG